MKSENIELIHCDSSDISSMEGSIQPKKTFYYERLIR